MNKTKWNHWQKKNICGKLKRTEEEKTQNVSKNQEETIRDSRGLGGGEGSRKEEDDVSLNHVTHARLGLFLLFIFSFALSLLSSWRKKKDEKEHNIKKLRLMLYVRWLNSVRWTFPCFHNEEEVREKRAARSGERKRVEMKNGNVVLFLLSRGREESAMGGWGGWTTQVGWWTRSKDRKRLRWVNKKPPEHRAERSSKSPNTFCSLFFFSVDRSTIYPHPHSDVADRYTRIQQNRRDICRLKKMR